MIELTGDRLIEFWSMTAQLIPVLGIALGLEMRQMFSAQWVGSVVLTRIAAVYAFVVSLALIATETFAIGVVGGIYGNAAGQPFISIALNAMGAGIVFAMFVPSLDFLVKAWQSRKTTEA
ncbi:hypothetical protein [Herbiconiux sp. VKM Ac-2851]|uniref:hypothetical protein n=1 Tax=Herbiconiux sp. VKM Ac-2851 TaxID=2739025 RepID=UPI001566421B|nr:hypothetical protein [Herbiconiux sp. VKM Ac-2851]NQX34060.1 hypothetical protein [Herbiconiux sp. VKM Ac-2851]